MGQKVHPHGFRLGYIYNWESQWFADKTYTVLLKEDLTIRRTIGGFLPDAAISRVEIERNANQVTVTVHTARPGIVIGRGGQRVDELRGKLEAATGKRIRVNISEIRLPEIEASLVARAVAEQLERRVSHRRAMKQAVARAMQRGVLGIKIKVSGRLGGSDMSRKGQEMEGRVPLHTLKADVDYGSSEARTTLGRIGVKVWIYKGDRVQEAQLQRRSARPTAAAAAAAAAAAPEAAAAEPEGAAAEPEAAVEAPAAEPEAAVEEPAAEPEAAVEEPAVEPEAAAEEPAAEPEPEAAPEEPKAEPEAAVEEPTVEPEAAVDEPAAEPEPEAAPEEPAAEPEAAEAAGEESEDASA